MRLLILHTVRKFTCLEAAKSTARLSPGSDVRMALLSSSTLEREKEFDILPTVLCPEPDGSLNSIGCRAREAFICMGHDAAAAVAACYLNTALRLSAGDALHTCKRLPVLLSLPSCRTHGPLNKRHGSTCRNICVSSAFFYFFIFFVHVDILTIEVKVSSWNFCACACMRVFS